MEAAQRLAEKSKAALQSVRQELTAECSAAKAQVEVERKLALEAEDGLLRSVACAICASSCIIIIIIMIIKIIVKHNNSNKDNSNNNYGMK